MLSDPAGLPVSNAAGVARVRAGGYAYFLESSSAEYHTSTDCGLVTVGGLLDSKGHGIVLPQGIHSIALVTSEMASYHKLPFHNHDHTKPN